MLFLITMLKANHLFGPQQLCVTFAAYYFEFLVYCCELLLKLPSLHFWQRGVEVSEQNSEVICFSLQFHEVFFNLMQFLALLLSAYMLRIAMSSWRIDLYHHPIPCPFQIHFLVICPILTLSQDKVLFIPILTSNVPLITRQYKGNI